VNESILFHRAVFFCKTVACLGFIVARYHSSDENHQDAQARKLNLTCRECEESHSYHEDEVRNSELIPIARLRQLYSEYYRG
jgi:hypothetical protein